MINTFRDVFPHMLRPLLFCWFKLILQGRFSNIFWKTFLLLLKEKLSELYHSILQHIRFYNIYVFITNSIHFYNFRIVIQRYSVKNVLKRPEACNFIKKETLAQVFPCEFCEISKNIFFHRTSLVAASAIFSSISLKVNSTLSHW